MEFVQVPLNIAVKASRVYRGLLPFVKKHIAQMKPDPLEVQANIPPDVVIPQDVADISDFVADSFNEAKEQLNKKSYEEIVSIAKEAGIKNPRVIKKEELIEKLLTEEII